MDDKARALRAFLIASDLTREQLIDALVTMGSDARAAAAALEQSRALPDSPLAQAAALAGVASWLDRIVSPARDLGAETAKEPARRAGRKGAKSRHAPTRDAKRLVRDWWLEHGAGRMNKEEAADAIVAARLVSEKRTTIRRWLQNA